MHYYLLDICYWSTVLLLYWFWFDSRNETIFRMCFLLTNGCLAVSVLAFRNSLVFHDMDCMTSMGIHMAPMIITTHIRWHMIPQDNLKPPVERQFTTLSTDLTLREYMWMNFWTVHFFYFTWFGVYLFVIMVLCWERI